MRYRFGFVSNSSSSSTVTIYRNDSKRSIQLHDLLMEMGYIETFGHLFSVDHVFDNYPELQDKLLPDQSNDKELYKEGAKKMLEDSDYSVVDETINPGERFMVEYVCGTICSWSFNAEKLGKKQTKKEKILKVDDIILAIESETNTEIDS